jgi:hypothetical protein
MSMRESESQEEVRMMEFKMKCGGRTGRLTLGALAYRWQH